MLGQVQMNFKLPALVEQEGDWFVALCPVLDVASQGRTHGEALLALTEATKTFLAACYELGTLDNVLKGVRAPGRDQPSRLHQIRLPTSCCASRA